MSKFVIRKATENDAESLLKIYEPYITNTTITFEYEVPTAEAFADPYPRNGGCVSVSRLRV